MALKETIENNIIVVLAAAVIASAGVTFAVVSYNNSEKLAHLEQSHDFEIKKMESELASIERDVPGIKHFDIRNLYVSNHATQTIDNNLNYFEDDNFYASISDKYWKYSKTSELGLAELIEGEKIDSSLLKKIAKSHPIHLWKASESFVMHGQEGRKNILFPYIVLQYLSYSSIEKLINIGISEARKHKDNTTDSNEKKMKKSVTKDNLRSAIKETFYNDITGTFFSFHNMLIFDMTMSIKNISIKVKKIQKIGDILYSQYVLKYSDIKVSGETTAVYIQHELMVIADRDGLYLIKIVLPSREPEVRADVYSKVNSWLASVKLLRN
ncbi:MAG: hypothetical protein K9M17_04105 [Mariprofundaceae bacterium]|nr:hypothetical protein [Mariprofundaceae bacterium]